MGVLSYVPDDMGAHLAAICQSWRSASGKHLRRLMHARRLVPTNEDVVLASAHTSWKSIVRVRPVKLSEPVLRFGLPVTLAPGPHEARILPLVFDRPVSYRSGAKCSNCVHHGEIVLISVEGVAQRPQTGFPREVFKSKTFGCQGKSTLIDMEDFTNRRSFHFRFRGLP